MDSPLEWLNLILRWTHVIAAIAWIGHAFLFNELDTHLVPPEEDDPAKGLEGEMWMLHGGGFYRVEKRWGWPTDLRGDLKWFRWEAAMTWLSGFLLLVVVFYLGGGVYLVDPSSSVSVGTAVHVGLAALVLGWVAYDLLCRSPLGHNGPVLAGLGLVAVTGLAWGLMQVMSGRAAFLHVGAVLATIMAANVWMLIIPTMRKMVAAVKEGGTLDIALGKRAKQRSRHNNYFVFPVIFLMISNHYPSLYGHDLGWLILGGMVLLGGLVKHVMNLRGDAAGPWLAATVAVAGALILAIVGLRGPEAEAETVPTGEARAVDPEQLGAVRGAVLFEGTVPPPRPVTLINCPGQEDGPALIQNVRATDGRLADVFVYVKTGYEGWEVPPVPQEAVVVDQRDCRYDPHVIGARVGQTVAFLNSDPVPHNVHTEADRNPTFNEMMVARDSRIEKVFRKPEVMVRARCDIHPWMTSWLGIVPHPWFAVTPAGGGFTLADLPPGAYVLEAWHEVLGTREQAVTVPEGGLAEVTFTFGDAATP